MPYSTVFFPDFYLELYSNVDVGSSLPLTNAVKIFSAISDPQLINVLGKVITISIFPFGRNPNFINCRLNSFQWINTIHLFLFCLYSVICVFCIHGNEEFKVGNS